MSHLTVRIALSWGMSIMALGWGMSIMALSWGMSIIMALSWGMSLSLLALTVLGLRDGTGEGSIQQVSGALLAGVSIGWWTQHYGSLICIQRSTPH